VLVFQNLEILPLPGSFLEFALCEMQKCCQGSVQPLEAGGFCASSLRSEHLLAEKKEKYLLFYIEKVALCTGDGFQSSC